ncbi:DUF1102 domain-containing protein [Halorubrum distributum]|uniref:DUF1102 domain-containing protein n=1 Tax=Halorubrum distributum TaxID=29283 RepID=UPI002954ED1B|nr:DUF1102 domain-containing protein [Halorubrum distributum]MDV7350873.1 DUF1102 domain-containing protein [Halorubrum distributum]
MNRRQFVIGLGATAAGGGAAVGTGAFTSVDADRTASVAVADEDQAYLGIIESPTANGAFATNEDSAGNVIQLDFNESIPDLTNPEGGVGVGQSSEYEFDDVFRIKNRGTQNVYVNIADVSTHSGDTLVRFYVPDGSGGRNHIAPGVNDLEVGVGSTENIGVYIDTAGESEYSTTPINSSGNTTITANGSSDDPVV